MSPNAPRPATILPVKPDVFMVLLVLLDGDRHGYGIMQDAAERSGGEVQLQPGALYRMLKRLLEEGLVEETTERKDEERRRYYRITDLGKQVAAAEARRMARLVEASRTHDLLDDAKYV